MMIIKPAGRATVMNCQVFLPDVCPFDDIWVANGNVTKPVHPISSSTVCPLDETSGLDCDDTEFVTCPSIVETDVHCQSTHYEKYY